MIQATGTPMNNGMGMPERHVFFVPMVIATGMPMTNSMGMPMKYVFVPMVIATGMPMANAMGVPMTMCTGTSTIGKHAAGGGRESLNISENIYLC